MAARGRAARAGRLVGARPRRARRRPSGRLSPPLVVSGLRRAYGQLVALDGLDLALEPGDVVALIGPNGCGKTTAVRTIAGLLEPTAGEVRVAGANIHREAEAEAAAALLVAATLPALLAAPLIGVASAGTAAAGLLVGVPAWALLVLCGSGSARRGGRIPLEVLALAAADATGGVSVLVWLFAWPLGAAIAVSASVVPAARHGAPAGAAVALAVAAALLFESLRRPARP